MELRKLAEDLRYENPKMAKLELTLLKQFGPCAESRGILFSKTRKSTRCLNEWVLSNSALQEAGIKAAMLTGAGSGSSSMTLVCWRTVFTYKSFRFSRYYSCNCVTYLSVCAS